MPDAETPTFPTLPDISDVHMAFGNIDALPKWEDIPEEFRRGNCYTKAVSDIFFKGGNLLDYFKPRPGLTTEIAERFYRAFVACLCSFEPKHEHKEAGVGYLASQFLECKPKEEKHD